MFDLIDPVELIWCSLAGRSNGCLVYDGPLAAVGLVPSLCLPSVLVSTISISKLAYAPGFYWLRALASCLGSVLFWLRASGISLWLRALVIALAGLSLGRHMRSLRYGG